MKRIFGIVALLVAGFAANAQQVETIKLEKLQEIMSQKTDHIKIINFWATWCAPCVKELPLFEKIGQERSDIKVMLVSMDLDLDPNPEKVYKFVTRKKLQSQVVILDAKDPNSYIDAIDKAKAFSKPVVTEVVPLNEFYEAEAYHQDYLARHPNERYIVVNDAPKVADLKKRFPELYVEK